MFTCIKSNIYILKLYKNKYKKAGYDTRPNQSTNQITANTQSASIIIA